MLNTFCAPHAAWCVAALMALVAPASAQPRPADKALATQELDVEGVVAEVIESARKNGVLSVRVRLRNNGPQPAKVSLVGVQGYVHTYVVAGNTKFPLLQDDRGQQLASPRDGGGWLEPTLKPRASFSWWGKFPAPPAEQQRYSLFLKVGPPIEDIPIIDKP